jgi:hypothetical protein
MLSIRFGYGRPAFFADAFAEAFCAADSFFDFFLGFFVSQTGFFMAISFSIFLLPIKR